MLDILERFLKKEVVTYSRLDGKTPVGSRQRIVDGFENDSHKLVFLASIKVGGLGLNITAANVVVIFEPDWNPSVDLQAQDRAYRIGQDKFTSIYRLVSAGTIEEKIYQRQIYKQQLAGIAVEGQSAPRYFDGVAGVKGQEGELFGLANLFVFNTEEGEENSLTKAILKGKSKELDFHITPHTEVGVKRRKSMDSLFSDIEAAKDNNGVSVPDTKPVPKSVTVCSKPLDQEGLRAAGVIFSSNHSELVGGEKNSTQSSTPIDSSPNPPTSTTTTTTTTSSTTPTTTPTSLLSPQPLRHSPFSPLPLSANSNNNNNNNKPHSPRAAAAAAPPGPPPPIVRQSLSPTSPVKHRIPGPAGDLYQPRGGGTGTSRPSVGRFSAADDYDYDDDEIIEDDWSSSTSTTARGRLAPPPRRSSVRGGSSSASAAASSSLSHNLLPPPKSKLSLHLGSQQQKSAPLLSFFASSSTTTSSSSRSRHTIQRRTCASTSAAHTTRHDDIEEIEDASDDPDDEPCRLLGKRPHTSPAKPHSPPSALTMTHSPSKPKKH
ncbi:snf2 super family [Pelomyxa schiedti]|nr:snf2 super family [Pelomyxa schiedti]